MVADPKETPWGTRRITEHHDVADVVHRRDLGPDAWRYARREVRARRWRRFSRDVFIAHNGPLTDDQTERAVLASCPPGSALAGLTAARRAGLRGFAPDAVYVTIPCGNRSPLLDGVVVHYSRFLGPEDVRPDAHPRHTRPARAVLDAAAWADSDRYARAIVLASVQQRLVTPAHLTDALPRRGPCLRHALIVESIEDAAGGIQSLPEREFEEICRAFGLPKPSRQVILRRPDGRYFLDIDFDEYKLSAEIDGRPHMDVLQWTADLDRANQVVVSGRSVMRFTSYAVRHERARVGMTLVEALTTRGWSGPSGDSIR